MDPSDRMPSFAQFVPQLTYDLIARIVPGILLMAIASMFWGERISSAGTLPLIDASQLWSLGNVPGIVLVAYFGSQILETIWYKLVDRVLEKSQCEKIEKSQCEKIGKSQSEESEKPRPNILCKILKKFQYETMEDEVKRRVIDDLQEIDPDEDSTKEDPKFPGIAFIYDTIRLKNPIAGSRIVKIRAEVQMYRNTFIGILLISTGLACEKWMLDCSFAQGFYALASGLLFSIILFIQASHRRRRLVWSLYNHWLLLAEPSFSGILTPRLSTMLTSIESDPQPSPHGSAR